MTIRFPGMNPYLEHPDLWPKIHPLLVSALAVLLQKKVAAGYVVTLASHTYRASGEPNLIVDETSSSPEGSRSRQQPVTIYVPMTQVVHESYIEIRHGTTNAVVTVVDILTPRRKRDRCVRRSYEQNCEKIFSSSTHFLEIDLLRGWEPIFAYGTGGADYRVLVSRSDQRPRAALYAWQVNEAIPPITVPLAGSETTLIDLKESLVEVQQQLPLELLDYSRPPLPPLEPQSATWLETLLGSAESP